ncbi:Hypothetical predicted protein, partial [Pelobates cultripes]
MSLYPVGIRFPRGSPHLACLFRSALLRTCWCGCTASMHQNLPHLFNAMLAYRQSLWPHLEYERSPGWVAVNTQQDGRDAAALCSHVLLTLGLFFRQP